MEEAGEKNKDDALERSIGMQRGASSMNADAPTSGPGKSATYRIRFRPALDIFSQGRDVTVCLNELRSLGRCRIVAQTEDIPYLEEFDPAICYLYWDAILTTNAGEGAVRKAFMSSCEGSTLKIDVIDEEECANNEKAYKQLGEILLERGDLRPGDLEEILSSKKRIGEMLVAAGKVSREKVTSALIEQQYMRELRLFRDQEDLRSGVPVTTRGFNSSFNLLDEFVMAQARLVRAVLSQNVPEFTSTAEEVKQLIEALRENILNFRMTQIRT